jgi:hypothetical protein
MLKKSTILMATLLLCVVGQLAGSEGAAKPPVEIPAGVEGLAAVLFLWGQDPEVHRLWHQASIDYANTVAELRAKKKAEGLTQEQAIAKYGNEAMAAIKKRDELMRQGADRLKIAACLVDEANDAKENMAQQKIADESKQK